MFMFACEFPSYIDYECKLLFPLLDKSYLQYIHLMKYSSRLFYSHSKPLALSHMDFRDIFLLSVVCRIEWKKHEEANFLAFTPS